MNSLTLISPSNDSGFQPILSGNCCFEDRKSVNRVTPVVDEKANRIDYLFCLETGKMPVPQYSLSHKDEV
ncbi:MAG: hypothetical protein JGK24_28350 [Microcoleus sp. PH2017_29_MFU_D_A]|jgi:hypothetical protein|uniref:hypothetical protein n=1 Tax=unclassified Microcoleus TaxID=2642155 RepID=UPI001DD4CF20|nr:MULTISPECIES: hypothetical protein [unclassified Microcoleus]MCC3431328.1 hypothetical protein [Microcoleus sp. PH2017_04_SCI_O_A]MCC3444715.1 hypothetical protein [Microcoleus sp. PH2017_03_ELD_O_A]MCC3469368.1 hypothetical protein [Microcoleus sp. PH2017_06_SFM_O_A]MCC3504901.1 hypothetical protein [Microcoleus sp. PH2017_19_SFW_U_A]TAE08641.1 MAG: hypothetical protein EAZ94_24505 [Oscillatoriales cyanobacterium]